MTVYRKTQVGTLVLVTLALGVALMLVIVFEVGFQVGVYITTGVLVVLALLFGSLTVEVSREAVTIRFGIGLVRKSFPLSEIREARAVRNSAYYGWGIRLTPHGWLYNVSGLDAVELVMGDRCVRVGTNRPRELLTAIAQASEGAVAVPES